MRVGVSVIGAVALGVTALPALAQSIDASIEASTDERRRGISWSDGRIAPAASVRLGLPSGLDLGVRVTGTREDARHGGADAVVDVTGGYGIELISGLRVDGFLTGHLFSGAAGRMDYVEGGVGASYALGPAEVGVDARYAPAQSAIGGDNLWLGARARVGIPMTPFTILGSMGRSSGSVDDPLRAARLRPGGSYSDWSLGVDHILGPLTLGVAYSGTDIDRDRLVESPYGAGRHAGDKVTARVAVTF